MLTAYLKKWQSFKKFYELGTELGYYVLPLSEVEDYIIRDYKKMFLNYFNPEYYFNNVSESRLKSLKEEANDQTLINIDNWKSKEFAHANQKKKGTGFRRIPPLILNSSLGNKNEVKKWLDKGANGNTRTR
ncbi:hypothetical protein [Fuchsiella alkaliacetigena]|uniref:hypothetical protein n=1 Tax=Fuchsiella alkaliacetigena TaxID=957042 RepID=UPI00200A10BF|nr:hypothetical protein [Fuchsiella alkaliacetigena]MCK8825488.1 hypothetical protein [Fuchsiella alkaliacetigena]